MAESTPSESPPSESPARVVVSVGTDKHPFDRLVGWVDSWAAANPETMVFIQHGNSARPVHAGGADLIPHAELLDMIAGSVVTVSHGGPSTVMDIRASGRLPIVVGRDPALGEHVDEHQLRFAEHLAKHDMALLASSERELHRLIDSGLAEPDAHRLAATGEGLAPGIRAFAAHMNTLLDITPGATNE